jgi:hypothetical protein
MSAMSERDRLNMLACAMNTIIITLYADRQKSELIIRLALLQFKVHATIMQFSMTVYNFPDSFLVPLP